jgi:trans-aconitate 2-methyltransferase
MAGPLEELTMEAPVSYYDCLTPHARLVDIWETEYFHVMDSAPAIVEWIASTGLRPFLAVLESEEERELFVSRLTEMVRETYLPQRDGRVLFPFRRTFVVAYR